MSIQINHRGLIGRLRLRSLSELRGEILNKTGRYIDGSYARVINAPIVTPFFQQGWGDLDIVDFDRDGWIFAKALVESKPLTGVCMRQDIGPRCSMRAPHAPRNLSAVCPSTRQQICFQATDLVLLSSDSLAETTGGQAVQDRVRAL
jgi:hypothetical protein